MRQHLEAMFPLGLGATVRLVGETARYTVAAMDYRETGVGMQQVYGILPVGEPLRGLRWVQAPALVMENQ